MIDRSHRILRPCRPGQQQACSTRQGDSGEPAKQLPPGERVAAAAPGTAAGAAAGDGLHRLVRGRSDLQGGPAMEQQG
ncbi:MAG: hypothetical protein ACRC1L_14765 [Prochlorococcaceae cyanobacterium]